MDHLGFSQKSNAGTLLSLLEAVGFIEKDGKLSERGRALLADGGTDEYARAMKDGIDQLLGKERADSIRAGSITREQLPGYLRQQFNVGQNVVIKFFSGLRWLAREARDEAILQACPSPARTIGVSKNGTKPSQIVGDSPTRRRAPRITPSENIPVSEATSFPAPQTTVTPAASEPRPKTLLASSLLGGETLQVRIDSGWKIEDVRATLRMLQMIERGELIPASEANQSAL
jgi:hypothetical protein